MALAAKALIRFKLANQKSRQPGLKPLTDLGYVAPATLANQKSRQPGLKHDRNRRAIPEATPRQPKIPTTGTETSGQCGPVC